MAPGVEAAHGGIILGDYSKICAAIDGSTLHYVFDQAWGDCQMGCLFHKASHLVCEPNQPPQLLEEWNNTENPEKPEWLARFPAYCP